MDVAWSTKKPDALVAVTTRRVVILPSRGIGVGEVVAVPRDRIRRVELTEKGELVIDDGAGGLLLGQVLPADRAEAIAMRLRAR